MSQGSEASEGASARPDLPILKVALHLGALWAFAVVQPLFDLLGRQPQFFVARGNTAADIVVLALVIVLVPPCVMAACVWAAGALRPVLGRALLLAFVAVLVAAIVLPPVGDLAAGSSVAFLPSGLIGVAAAALYARFGNVRSFLTVLSPVPLLFLVLFLVASPVSRLIVPRGDGDPVAGPTRATTPVVVIVLDELATTSLIGEDNRVDRRQFPALASLSDDATWYRNATTVADGTTEGVPAILTGVRPKPGALPTYADHPRNLFTLFSRSHDLEVVEPVTDLCPRRLCAESRPSRARRLRSLAADLRIVAGHLILPDDVRGSLPAIDRGWEGFEEQQSATPPAAGKQRTLHETVVERLGKDDPAEHFTDVIRAVRKPRSRPPMIFLHATLPHVPWRFLPNGRQYAAHRSNFPGLEDDLWGSRQWLADQGFQRHLAQTQYADRLVGRLLAALRAANLYDKSVIVVTADHGLSFRAGDRRRVPTRTNLADIAGVPLLVKGVRQRAPRVDQAPVKTIDILPTIAAHLDVRLPWRVDGVSADARRVDGAAKVEVSHQGESSQTLPFKDFVRQRDQRERYERSLSSGGSSSRRDVFAIGSDPLLMGRRVSEFKQLPAGGAKARIDAASEFAAVDPDAPVLPVFVSGTVQGVEEGRTVAVAVNGRIEGTSRVYDDGDVTLFTTLVAPAALRRGSNAVEVLEPAGEGRVRRLGRLESVPSYRLVTSASGEQLVGPDQRMPVEPGAATGYLDYAEIQPGTILIRGWAADGTMKAPAERIVAVAADRSIHVESPTRERVDLSAQARGLRFAGFEFTLPLEKVRGSRLRLFGIEKGRATELPAVEDAPRVLASLSKP